MMPHPSASSIPLDLIAGFSATGRVYRAFDRLIAAQMGSVLLVPIWLSRGDLSGTVDGCPVPWDEIQDLLHLERVAVSDFALEPDTYSDQVIKMAALAKDGWSVDVIHVNRHPQGRAWRFSHRSGICYAVVAELVPRVPGCGQ